MPQSLWLPQGSRTPFFFALEDFVTLLVPPGMLTVPVMWPSPLRCGASSPLGFASFLCARCRVSFLRFWWTSVCLLHVIVFWSRELSPWTQVEQNDICLVMLLHFLEDIVVLFVCVWVCGVWMCLCVVCVVSVRCGRGSCCSQCVHCLEAFFFLTDKIRFSGALFRCLSFGESFLIK